MRQYKLEQRVTGELEKIICNKCGKEIEVIQGIAQEDYLAVKKRWGYFSDKDNQEDEFDLCEDCYDELVASFKIRL